jgi:PEP-CTERM motif
MNFRFWMAAGCVAAPLVAGTPAFADVIDLGTSGGRAVMGFNDYESFGNLHNGNLQIGSTNYGVFEVTSITVNGDSTYAPGPGGYLLGVFSGITVSGIGGTVPNINTQNTGGTFSIYNVTATQLSTAGQTIATIFNQGTGGYAAAGGTCAVNMQCYNGITNVGGTNVLDFDLVPGADAAGSTLVASLNAAVVPPTGSANGFGDITGGSDQSAFFTGVFPTGVGTFADLNLSNEFCPNGAGTGRCFAQIGDWANQSFDPVVGNTIPEPGSLALLGCSLLGMRFIGFRRRKTSHSK